MKKLTLLILLIMVVFSYSYSQSNLEINTEYTDYQIVNSVPNLDHASRNTILYLDWSSPNAYQRSSSPLVTGYGFYSDSLSKAYNGKTFFANGDEYYMIESWADYYYWYTKKFWFKFKNPETYEFYYLSNNDYEMAKYIVSHNYLGKYYPSLITIDFQDLKYAVNRLRDDKYFAQEMKRLNELEKDLVKPDFEKSNNENFHKNDKIEFKNMDKSKRVFDKNLEKPERAPANSKIVK